MALEQELSGTSPAGVERFMLHTDWRGYGKILDAIGEHHLLVTYDSGRLELLSPSPEHELAKALLGSLVETLLEERGTGYLRGGSITFRRKVLDKGMEPDDCFWIAHRKAMINVKRWLPRLHPPPDLVLEIEVSQSLVGRLPILAALGVPEVWRWRDQSVLPMGLEPDQSYQPLANSRMIPGVDFAVLSDHMRMADRHDTFEIKQAFRSRLRA